LEICTVFRAGFAEISGRSGSANYEDCLKIKLASHGP